MASIPDRASARCWVWSPLLNHLTDAVGVVGLVGQHDGARAEMIEQAVCDRPVLRPLAVRPRWIGMPCA